MATATMTSKGQTTIPAKIRDFLSLHAGDKIEFVMQEDGRVFMVPKKCHISELKGFLPRPKKTASLEDMDKAIKKGANRDRFR